MGTIILFILFNVGSLLLLSWVFQGIDKRVCHVRVRDVFDTKQVTSARIYVFGCAYFNASKI
jgi:hypothetical protein